MTYRYYKYLDLDWQEAATKLAAMSGIIIREAWLKRTGFLVADRNLEIPNKVPELVKMFEPLNITVRSVAFHISNFDFHLGNIHTDDAFSGCRINFPIKNCNDTETHFYKCNARPIKMIDRDYNIFDPARCTSVDHFKLTQPVLFRTIEPHKVICNHDKLRIACSLGFYENLEYLLE